MMKCSQALPQHILVKCGAEEGRDAVLWWPEPLVCFHMRITTEPFAIHSLVGFQPPSPMASWCHSVEPISLMCLCWTHSGVFRINVIMIIRTGNSRTRQARASRLATKMYRRSGSALISRHLGHSHHLFSAGSNVPFCLLCSKSLRIAKLRSVVLGLASFSQNWPRSLGGYKSENMAGFVVDSFSWDFLGQNKIPWAFAA